MDALHVGPFALPIGPLVLLAAYLGGSLVARLVSRNRQVDVEPMLWSILIVGLATARIAFVIMYLDAYRTSPWSMVDIRDGGFSPIAGFLAATAFAAVLIWRKREARKPLLLSTLAGAIIWGAGLAAMTQTSTATAQMPDLTLSRLDGGNIRLQSLIGKPLVINIWATWCPPCRREMPVLRDAQSRYQDVTFVFVNQGESVDAIRKYLSSEGLALGNVLLDPRMQLAGESGSYAMPTSLFFNRQGRLIDRRMGELSSATLEQRIAALRKAE